MKSICTICPISDPKCDCALKGQQVPNNFKEYLLSVQGFQMEEVPIMELPIAA